jgi:predicted O-linked N-acetylglucosamine transferase (SPINDLY family)
MNDRKPGRQDKRAASKKPVPEETDGLVALFAQGRFAEVAGRAQAFTERHPWDGFGWKLLCAALMNAGRNADALAAAQRAAALAPSDVETHYNLGNILKALGRLDEAAAGYRRALEIKPDSAEALNNLGLTLADLGRPLEAEECYRRALAIKPTYARANNNLGLVLFALDRFNEAEVCYRRALEATPSYAEALSNLGLTLRSLDRLNEAEACHRRALVIRPDLAQAHYNLGNVLQDQCRLHEAGACFRNALSIKPDFAWALSNLGTTLLGRGLSDESEVCHRRAIAIRPDYAELHSNLLHSLNYHAGEHHSEVLADYQAYEERFSLSHRDKWCIHNNDLDANRRLKVGYVSPDLRRHSAAYFIEPLLREHDHELTEVFCYAHVARPDQITARLRRFADHWISSVGLSDDDLAQRITEDRIDILVDLAGHTANNRLPVFARKPAPVQITWLGYPNTTGLSAMDYRFVDAVTDPPGEADLWAQETLIRLEDGFLCYAPPPDAPKPASPPCLASGTVTFGSFNNAAKLSAATFDTWAALLARIPGSRLLAKDKSFTDAACKAAFLARVSQRGVDPGRVTLLGFVQSLEHHLAVYNQVDIALDPFPYNGTTTTCEALWMGVPVVTLRGDRHAGRVGASLLTHTGLRELIGFSVEHYLDIAAALAGDPARLIGLRQTMRERLTASPLCNAQAFARKIEFTYRRLWQRHCGVDKEPSSVHSGF